MTDELNKAPQAVVGAESLQDKFEAAFLSWNGFHTKAELAMAWENGRLAGEMFRAGAAIAADRAQQQQAGAVAAPIGYLAADDLNALRTAEPSRAPKAGDYLRLYLTVDTPRQPMLPAYLAATPQDQGALRAFAEECVRSKGKAVDSGVLSMLAQEAIDASPAQASAAQAEGTVTITMTNTKTGQKTEWQVPKCHVDAAEQAPAASQSNDRQVTVKQAGTQAVEQSDKAAAANAGEVAKGGAA